jgi:hypothetical protein
MLRTRIAPFAALALLAGCAPHPTARDQVPPLVIFFLDGVQLSQAGADSIWQGIDSGRETDSVRVLKDPKVLAEYGAEGRPGVVLIFLRKGMGGDGPLPIRTGTHATDR